MSQPDWEIVDTLGDYNLVDYSGSVIYIDKTGVYDPECEHFEPNEQERTGGTAYRFELERCTYINGILSDNKYHTDYSAWWADKIDSISVSCDVDPEELLRLFCSEDIRELGMAYELLALCYGYFELDQYPLTLTQAEAEERYADALEFNRRSR